MINEEMDSPEENLTVYTIDESSFYNQSRGDFYKDAENMQNMVK